MNTIYVLNHNPAINSEKLEDPDIFNPGHSTSSVAKFCEKYRIWEMLLICFTNLSLQNPIWILLIGMHTERINRNKLRKIEKHERHSFNACDRVPKPGGYATYTIIKLPSKGTDRLQRMLREFLRIRIRYWGNWCKEGKDCHISDRLRFGGPSSVTTISKDTKTSKDQRWLDIYI